MNHDRHGTLRHLLRLLRRLFLTIGIGNSYDDAGLLSALLVEAGLMLLSTSLALWTRR